MRIVTYLNTSKWKVENKNFNIFIGISLGNKYFSEENIKNYILWALDNTKEKIAVVIADKINAINYEIKAKYSKQRALSVALRRGEEKKQIVEKIVINLPKEKRKDIFILKWEDIEGNNEYKRLRKIIENNFIENKKFHQAVIDVVRESTDLKHIELHEEDYEKLTTYVISELPIFLSGLEYKGFIFNLNIYPGLGKIDYLAIDLQNGKNFPEITKQINLKDKMMILEGYED